MEKRLNTISDLESLRASLIEERDPKKLRIALCGGTGCLASGAREVADAFKEELKKPGVIKNGEINLCRIFTKGKILISLRIKKVILQV